MKFYDLEHDVIISEEELKEEFIDLFSSGGTDCRTFAEYVRSCTGKNGTLEILN